MPEKIFVLPSFLEAVFTGYSDILIQYVTYVPLSCRLYLSIEKLVVTLIFGPIHIVSFFLL